MSAAAPPAVRVNSGRLVQGSVLSLGGGVVAALGGFLLTLAVARGLGTTRSGVFFVSLGIFTLLANVLELGADTGLVWSIPRLRTLGRTADLGPVVVVALAPVAVAGVLAAVLVGLFAPHLAAIFMEQGSTVLGGQFLRTVAPYLAFAPLATVMLAGTRGFGTVVPFVSVQNVALPLARPAAIALLVAAGLSSDRVIATAWGLPWAAAAAVGALVLARQIRRTTATAGTAGGHQPLGGLGKEFWSFAGARAFAGAADTTLVWLDVLLVGWLVGPHDAGIYATASRFVTTGTLALQATRIATAPALSRLITAGDRTAAERVYHGATRGVIVASWPLYIGLACFAPTILRIFGHDFSRGGTALTILAGAMLVDVATGNVGTVLLMGGGSRWNLLNSTTGLLVDVVLDLLLIPTHGAVGGAVGAAIGWAAAIVVINVMTCLEVHYLMGLRVVDAPTLRLVGTMLGLVAVPGVLLAGLGGRSVVALVTWLAVTAVGVGSWIWRNRTQADVTDLVAALRTAVPARNRPAP